MRNIGVRDTRQCRMSRFADGRAIRKERDVHGRTGQAGSIKSTFRARGSPGCSVTPRTRRMLIASSSVLLAAVAAVAAIVTFTASPSPSPVVQVSADARNSAMGTSTVSPSPSPTPAASRPPQAVPSAASSRTPAPAGSTAVRVSKLAQVDVVTTFAGWNGLSHAIEVGGYASVVEPVGTCTLRLSHGGKVVTRNHTASADATTVACGGFSIPRSELGAGDWTAVLAYRSSRSSGQSAAVTLNVP